MLKQPVIGDVGDIAIDNKNIESSMFQEQNMTCNKNYTDLI